MSLVDRTEEPVVPFHLSHLLGMVETYEDRSSLHVVKGNIKDQSRSVYQVQVSGTGSSFLIHTTFSTTTRDHIDGVSTRIVEMNCLLL